MQRIVWIGALALVGLAVWLYTADEGTPASGSPSDSAEVRDPRLEPRSPATARAPARDVPAARPRTYGDTDARSDGEPATAATGSERDYVRSTPGGTTPPPTPTSTRDALSTGGASGGSAARGGTGNDVVGADERPTGRGTPISDEAVREHYARRGLGDEPTETELNERRGWFDTLSSTLTDEERERVTERAVAEGAHDR